MELEHLRPSFEHMALHSPKEFVRAVAKCLDEVTAVEMLYWGIILPGSQVRMFLNHLAKRNMNIYLAASTKYPDAYNWSKHYSLLSEDALQKACLKEVLVWTPHTYLSEASREVWKFMEKNRYEPAEIDAPVELLEKWRKAAPFSGANHADVVSIANCLQSWVSCCKTKAHMVNLLEIFSIIRSQTKDTDSYYRCKIRFLLTGVAEKASPIP